MVFYINPFSGERTVLYIVYFIFIRGKIHDKYVKKEKVKNDERVTKKDADNL